VKPLLRGSRGFLLRRRTVFVASLVWALMLLSGLALPVTPASAATPACGPLVGGVHQVSTEEHLKAVGRGLDDAGDCGRRALYLQTQSIQLTGLWTPIPVFRGTYDGGGHQISGLVIERDGNVQGMFTFLAGPIVSGDPSALVKNVNLVDARVAVPNIQFQTGAIAGALENGAQIINSSASGTVTGGQRIGGLVGTSDGTISKSYSSVNVSGTNGVGGIVGVNWGEIFDSYSSGTVSGSLQVGGLVGDNVTGFFGFIESSYSIGPVTGASDVGGLVGRNTSEVRGSLYNSETSGQNDTGKGLAKSTAELKSIATYTTAPANWDIVQGWVPYNPTGTPARIWGICPEFNSGYPFLLWQASSNPCVVAPSTNSVGASPAIHMDLKATVGNLVAGAPVLMEGEGLKPGSAYSLIVRSNPHTLMAGTVSEAGRFSHTVRMPAGIAPGLHTITFSAVGSGGQQIFLSQAFTVGNSGEFAALGSVSGQNPRGLAATGVGPSLLSKFGLLTLGLLAIGAAFSLAHQRLGSRTEA